jgi:hypothetical protein
MLYFFSVTTMKPIDLSPLLKDYEGKWVAISDDHKSVFASANSAKEAADLARKKGHSEYTLLFVQPFDLLYCG